MPQDFAEAVRWYRLAAEQGLAEAQFILGFAYYNGEGVPQDFAEAVRWVRLAAEQGYARRSSASALPTPPVRAWRRTSRKPSGGSAWLPSRDTPVRRTTSADLAYATGEGVPQDFAEAVRWYRLAAEQGYASAQNNLGLAYATGEGVPQDFAEAVRWFRRAAEQGLASAQFNLGFAYANGEGVPQDSAEAVRWYRRAAEQGEDKAQYALEVMYRTGDGVPQNNVEAHMWFNLAASRSSGADRERSVGARDAVAELMTPAYLSAAQRSAQQWHAAHTVP